MADLSPDFARRLEQVIVSQFSGKAAELARALNCERATVGTWRRGRVPSRELLRRLTAITGYEESWFLEGRAGPVRTTFKIPGDHVGAAITSGHGPGRIGNLVNFLRESLEPELRHIYSDSGVPFTDAYAGKLISDAVTDIGEGEPDRPVYHPELWPHLLRLIAHAHQSAVKWVSSHIAEPEPVKKRPRVTR